MHREQEMQCEFVNRLRTMSRSRWRFLPGALALLSDIRSLNIPTALCSNQTAVWAAEVLDVLPIQNYFDTIVFSCEQGVEASKSHASLKIYDRLMNKLRARLGQTPNIVYFWDDRFTNTITAKRAGLQPYWIDLTVVDPVRHMRYMLDRVLEVGGHEDAVLCYDLGGLFVADHAEDLLWGPGGFADEYDIPLQLVKSAHLRLWYDDKFATTSATARRTVEQLEYDYYTRLARYVELELGVGRG